MSAFCIIIVVQNIAGEVFMQREDWLRLKSGTDVRGMSYADIMVMFYDGYRPTETEDTSSAIKLTLSGGGEVTLAGNGYAVTKKA